MQTVTTVPLLMVDNFGMRTLPHTAAEDLLEIIVPCCERASTLVASSRPVGEWPICWLMRLPSV